MTESPQQSPPIPGEHNDYYRRLRARMQAWLASKTGQSHAWAEILFFAPDFFHLLCRLSLDARVPLADKARLAAAIAYFIAPFDLLPELIAGPIGYLDDIALAAYVLQRMLNGPNAALVQEHWAGRNDVIQVVQRALDFARRHLGAGVIGRLRGFLRD